MHAHVRLLVAFMAVVLSGNGCYSAVAPTLGEAAAFSVLAGSTVTNTGPSEISSFVGVSPGSALVGLPAAANVQTPLAAEIAQTALTAAYIQAAAQPCDSVLTGVDLGGLRLLPGTYCFSSSAQLTGTLTLSGASDSVYIFQIGSSLTTSSGSSVEGLAGCNVFWQVGSSATLGAGSSFAGTILALTSISLTTSAAVNGRVLARNGAVTLQTNSIVSTNCTSVTPGGGTGGGSGGGTGGGGSGGGSEGGSGACCDNTVIGNSNCPEDAVDAHSLSSCVSIQFLDRDLKCATK